MAGDNGVMRRKVAGARNDGDRSVTGARAWRVALARAARDALGLELDAQSLRDDRRSLAELLDLMPERALFAVLEGPGQGLGVLVMSLDMLASVIEVQTIGKVGTAPPLPRRPTRTDAAMVASLIDQALAGLESALATSPDLRWTAGFRYASFLEDARPLALLLEDAPLRVLIADYAIASGARTGQVILALPAEGKGPHPVSRDGSDLDDDERAWSVAFETSVLGAEVTLDAIIGRLSIPLAQALELAPGMEFVLPDARISKVSLVGSGGQAAGTGKLGQAHGMRAIRISAISGQTAERAMPTRVRASAERTHPPNPADAPHPDAAETTLQDPYSALDLDHLPIARSA